MKMKLSMIHVILVWIQTSAKQLIIIKIVTFLFQRETIKWQPEINVLIRFILWRVSMQAEDNCIFLIFHLYQFHKIYKTNDNIIGLHHMTYSAG